MPVLTFALAALVCLMLANAYTPVRNMQSNSPTNFDHVIMVSIDGFRPDALEAAGTERLPALHTILNGPHTLNARTDAKYTYTLPNHTGMMTGRHTSGPEGHNWTANVDPPRDATLHKHHGAYIASVFDVAHDHGMHTALLAGKTKFSLYKRSYDSENGAPDTTGEDNGPDKIDHLFFGGTEQMADDAIAFLLDRADGRTLMFIHFAQTDLTGHGYGWDLQPESRYLAALMDVDAALARLHELITTDERLTDKTAIIITSDHGGGEPFRSHGRPKSPLNYTIPFIVWLGDKHDRADLYLLNPEVRRDPGADQISADAPGQPIRNADATNLALSLLGLPPVTGSTVNADQNLRVLSAK